MQVPKINKMASFLFYHDHFVESWFDKSEWCCIAKVKTDKGLVKSMMKFCRNVKFR